MKIDRVLAALLIVACFISALAVFLTPHNAPVFSLGGDGKGPADIGLFEINGVISDGDLGDPFPSGPSNSTGASQLIKLLRQAEKDGVKAILLKVNSPGGTAAASQSVFEELMRIRKNGKIKIVASFGDVAASGAYYISAAADRIVANPASTVGSIGVILHITDVSALMGKIGVRASVIKSGPYKDILSPYRSMTDRERAILQNLVDGTYAQFVEAVARGRRQPIAKIKALADGRIFTGSAAKENALVDDLGNYLDAIRTASKLAGVKGEPNVRNYSTVSFWEKLVPKLESSLSFLPQGSLNWNKVNKIPLTLME